MSDREAADTEIKKCFVITPIGVDGSVERRAADGILDAAIIPTLAKFEFSVEVAHRLSSPGSINRQVITRLLEADLVVANLSFLNPNVFYELAVRHSARKPVISIAVDGTKLPFDLADERTIFYTDDMQGVVDFVPRFEEAVKKVFTATHVDNPVYRVADTSLITANTVPTNAEQAILDRIASLESLLLELSQGIGRSMSPQFIDLTEGASYFQSKNIFNVYVEAPGMDDVATFAGELASTQSPVRLLHFAKNVNSVYDLLKDDVENEVYRVRVRLKHEGSNTKLIDVLEGIIRQKGLAGKVKILATDPPDRNSFPTLDS